MNKNTPIQNQKPTTQLQWDAVVYGWRNIFVVFSPFIAVVLAFYLIRRGTENLLVSPETIEGLRWFATLPIEGAVAKNTSLFFLESLLLSNSFAFITVLVSIQFILAPRPIFIKFYKDQLVGNFMKSCFLVAFLLLSRIWLAHAISFASTEGHPNPYESKAGILYLLLFLTTQIGAVFIVYIFVYLVNIARVDSKSS